MSNPSQQIMRLGFGFAVSQALRVIIELGIPDLLAVGEQSVDELATATQSDADALYRVMRLLAPEGVFREVLPRRFELTEVGAVLRSDRPGPRDFIRMINSEAYLAFEQLLHSVRTGKPAFDKVFGSQRFDWLSKHPEQAALFQRAMVALSQGSNEAVAEAYDFRPFTRVVDVGGGHGQLLSAILARNPHLSGVLFDLPSGVAAAHRVPVATCRALNSLPAISLRAFPLVTFTSSRRSFTIGTMGVPRRSCEIAARLCCRTGKCLWPRRLFRRVTNRARSRVSTWSCSPSLAAWRGRRRSMRACSTAAGLRLERVIETRGTHFHP